MLLKELFTQKGSGTVKPKDNILIVGCGELGGILLELLCRVPGIGDIVVTDVNEDWGRRKVNSAILGSSYMGLYPKITFQEMDLLDTDRTAEQINTIDPCVIYNGTTLQSWWVVNEIPAELNARIYKPKVGLGAWIPMHLALSTKLMKAVKKSGINTHVVNSSFPDATNVSLSRIGMAPTVGIGNGDLMIPYIKKTASEILDIPMRNINVDLVAHHYHCYHWARDAEVGTAPFYLQVYDGCNSITDELGNWTDFIPHLAEVAARPGGRHGQYQVAASSLKNLLAIYFDTNELTMAPGPQGLEGGYPVRIGRKGAEVVLPDDLTLEAARGLMLEAQQHDGIKTINEQGGIELTEEAVAMLSGELGVNWSVVNPEESFDQAMELRTKFREWLSGHGVTVPQ